MIIGLTGTIGSGKGIIADFLKEQGFIYLSLSNVVRETAKERSIEITRKNLQDLGNELREKEGGGVLANFIINKIKNQEYDKVVIDGIRNPFEVEVLKNLKNFFLVSIDSSQKIRFNRVNKRNRPSDPNTWEEFLEIDDRDKGIGEIETGQNVGKCMELADFSFVNDGSLEDFQNKIKRSLEEINQKT